MMQTQQIPINWTEIGVIIGAISVTLAVLGWFVVHKLAAQRDKQQRRERCERAISDFEVSINKCEKSIKDTHVPRNQVWGFTLSGGLDNYAAEINEVCADSTGEIESSMRAIRPFMNTGCKARLDEAWQTYQEYKIEGRDAKDPDTGQEFTSHVECKAELIECLEQLKKIAQETKI